MDQTHIRAVKIGKAVAAAIIIILWVALFMGCSTITDAASKIKLPTPSIVWTADNATVTTSAPVPTTTTVKAAEGATVAAGDWTHAAPVTCTLTHRGLTASLWSYSRTAVDWPKKEAKKGGYTDAEVHLYVWRDGRWQGGKLDHARTGTSGTRDFANIYENNYQIWATLKPQYGERVCFVLFHYDFKERSNAVFDTWKGR